MPIARFNSLKVFRVVINNGTATTHVVVVRARSHEEAEAQALHLVRIRYEDVVKMSAQEVQ